MIALSAVQALIDAALERQQSAVLELLTEREAAPVAVAGTSDAGFARELAMHIAQLTDQESGRKRLSPEVVEARRLAQERMVDLILAARVRGMEPVYTLKHKVYLDEVLIDPLWRDKAAGNAVKSTEIGWPGVPNLAMTPLNDVAIAIYDAYLASMGHSEAPQTMDRLTVTANGLTVVSGRQPMPRQPTATHVPVEGVTIRGRGVPGAIVQTHILGTVAAPARENMV